MTGIDDERIIHQFRSVKSEQRIAIRHLWIQSEHSLTLPWLPNGTRPPTLGVRTQRPLHPSSHFLTTAAALTALCYSERILPAPNQTKAVQSHQGLLSMVK
jgi:hypothetical protein